MPVPYSALFWLGFSEVITLLELFILLYAVTIILLWWSWDDENCGGWARFVDWPPAVAKVMLGFWWTPPILPKLPEMPLLLVVFKIFKPLILARPDTWKGAC